MIEGIIVYASPAAVVTAEALGTTTAGGALTGVRLNVGPDNPIVPGSVVLTASGSDTQVYTDLGNGVIDGSGAGIGTVDYATGAITITSGGGNAAVITATSYSYFGGPYTPRVAEPIGTPAGGGLTTSLDFVPVAPGSVVISNGANTFSDNGLGVLTGAPAGSGTINYITGEIVLVTADTTASTATYRSLNPPPQPATPTINLPNAIEPTFATFRNEETANGVLVQVSSNLNGPWITKGQRTVAAWANIDLGLLPFKFVRVFASAKGRLNGIMANPV